MVFATSQTVGTTLVIQIVVERISIQHQMQWLVMLPSVLVGRRCEVEALGDDTLLDELAKATHTHCQSNE